MTAAAQLFLEGLREAMKDPGFREEILTTLGVMPEEPDAWITAPEAAEYLGLSKASLYKLTSARRIPFRQDVPGGKTFFKKTELDAWRRGPRNA